MTANLNPKADLASNPNIMLMKDIGSHSSQYQGRTPLAATLSKAGMSNRAKDYVWRALHPEENKFEPLPKDPEPSPNMFSAENHGSVESIFQKMYSAMNDLTKRFGTNPLSMYNKPTLGKKQIDYNNRYSPYNGLQYRPNGAIKKDDGKNKINSLVEQLEKTSDQYFKNIFNPQYNEAKSNVIYESGDKGKKIHNLRNKKSALEEIVKVSAA